MGESVVEQRLRIGKTLIRRRALHDDGDELQPVALRRSRKTAPRRLRPARLDAGHTFVGFQHLVGILRHHELYFRLGPFHEHLRLTDDVAEIALFHRVASQLCHIARRRIMIVVCETIRIVEMRMRHAELFRLVIHALGKSRHRAADLLRQGHGRAVIRLHHHAVDEFVRLQLLPRLQPQWHTLRVGRCGGNRHEIVHLQGVQC